MSLTVGVSVVTLGRGVPCVTNSNPDHSLWISYLLQSYKKEEKSGEATQTETYLGDASDFGFIGGHTHRPHHLIRPPLKLRNKTPSDPHVG